VGLNIIYLFVQDLLLCSAAGGLHVSSSLIDAVFCIN